MFARITKAKGRRYLQLIEAYRENGKPRQRVVANLGNVEELARASGLERIADQFLAIAGARRHRLEELVETDRLVYGHAVYRRLWKKLGLERLLGEAAGKRRIRFDLPAAVFLMAMDRLLAPCSKRASHQRQGRYVALPAEVELNHLYRALDLLAREKEHLEDMLFEHRRNLFNLRVNVVLYDVTTFHFESVRGDALRDFGFSKAGKFNEVQVVLGLLADENGCPIGFDLFPGDTFEGKTLLKALEKLARRFEIGQVVIAADAAMNNKNNLLAIESAGYRYVVSAPLRKAEKTLREHALNPDGYVQLHGEPGETVHYKIIEPRVRKVTDAQGEKQSLTTRVICTWSQKRAEKDRKDRERLIEKARAIEENTSMNDKRGHRRYVRTDGETRANGLDLERIEADAAWDGYHAIETNDAEFSAQRLLEIYRQLWRIEQSFRIMKSTLETRPIFHWTPRRIEGHFVLCFLSFLLERTLEITLHEKNIHASPEAIVRALNSLQVSRLEIEKTPYYLKGASDPLANKILRALSMTPIRNLTALQDFRLP